MITEVLELFPAGPDSFTGPANGPAGKRAYGGHLAAQALVGKLGAIVVLKHGPQGCSIYQNGIRLDTPGFVVDEVDPTGAGDCFSAAFIAGLESGWPLDQVGRFANAAGALAVTKMGPMEGAPTKKQVEDFYA